MASRYTEASPATSAILVLRQVPPQLNPLLPQGLLLLLNSVSETLFLSCFFSSFVSQPPTVLSQEMP